MKCNRLRYTEYRRLGHRASVELAEVGIGDKRKWRRKGKEVEPKKKKKVINIKY